MHCIPSKVVVSLTASLTLLAASTPPTTAANAAKARLAGPVLAQVERVVDGDTIAVKVRIWVDQELRVLVRIRGIDAPETRGRCADETRRAKRASAYVAAALASGRVELTNISGGKYWGRVLADVRTSEGRDVGAALLKVGLARPYRGKRRNSWCAVS